MDKKIFLVVSPVYEPYAGGGASYFPAISRFLSKHGKVFVITEFHKDKDFFEDKGQVKVGRILTTRDCVKPKNLFLNYIKFLINYTTTIVIIILFSLKKGKKYIIYTRNYQAPYVFFLKLFKLTLGRGVILINDVRTELPDALVKKVNLSFFDKTHVNSEAINNQFLVNDSLRGVDYKYIANAVFLPKDTDCHNAFKNTILTSRKFVLFCGPLGYRKSFDLVLPVMKLICRRFNMIPVIVGREMDFTEGDIKKCLTNIDYIYYENISQKSLYWLEKEASLVLLPSRMEGLPRVSIETLCFHGHIVLPSCCPEFKEALKVKDLSVLSLYRLSLNRIKTEYKNYDISIHSFEDRAEEYFNFITT
jgi:hypothetical protein